MGGFIANQVVKAMIKKQLQVNGAEVLMLGITFKENCGDIRNTKIVDVVCALKDYGINVTITDPWADAGEVHHEYGLEVIKELPEHRFDAVILGVAHQEFLDLHLSSFLRENGVVYDVKGVLADADYTL